MQLICRKLCRPRWNPRHVLQLRSARNYEFYALSKKRGHASVKSPRSLGQKRMCGTELHVARDLGSEETGFEDRMVRLCNN